MRESVESDDESDDQSASRFRTALGSLGLGAFKYTTLDEVEVAGVIVGSCIVGAGTFFFFEPFLGSGTSGYMM